MVLRSASDGFEALVRAGQRVPDVLVTDILMPGMDGIALLHRLRKVPEFASTRLVVVSAVSPDALPALGGLPAGVIFLQKPVDPAQLMAAVTGDSVSSIPSHSL
jgi:CheY-like chemotaxis protein